MMVVIGFGITAGAHRLWAHRAYKAKLPLRVLLMFLNSMSFQNSIYEWARDHRYDTKLKQTERYCNICVNVMNLFLYIFIENEASTTSIPKPMPIHIHTRGMFCHSVR